MIGTNKHDVMLYEGVGIYLSCVTLGWIVQIREDVTQKLWIQVVDANIFVITLIVWTHTGTLSLDVTVGSEGNITLPTLH